MSNIRHSPVEARKKGTYDSINLVNDPLTWLCKIAHNVSRKLKNAKLNS